MTIAPRFFYRYPSRRLDGPMAKRETVPSLIGTAKPGRTAVVAIVHGAGAQACLADREIAMAAFGGAGG
jgi:alpha-D-ribose 1-methylphosphonate 5-triphosphate synthase subunit PhnL